MLITMMTITYLVTSISGAQITCWLLDKKSPKNRGSKNLGATNMFRVNGIKAAFLTLLFDVLKMLVPLFLSQVLAMQSSSQMVLCVTGVVGHMFPIFHEFKGGKGVATAFSCMCFMAPLVAVIAFFYWVFAFIVTRTSSVASLLTAFSTLLWLYVSRYPNDVVLGFTVVVLLVSLAHISNIKRLYMGSEQTL